MNPVLPPWYLMVIFLASWINRQQQEVIECLRTENAVLKDKLGKKRILLNDDQRRRLAVKGKIFGRKVLDKVGTLFTPDTILCWHRQLVARKWNYSDRKKKQGRPCFRRVIVIWFCSLPRRIRAGLRSDSGRTLHNPQPHQRHHRLQSHGIDPAPDRKRTGSWATFLKSHWDVLAAIDFTRLKSGPGMDWSLSICSTSWSSRLVASISPDARPAPTNLG